ncbi:hypothetical protein PLEOSDRAFT_1082780 [Pleurotus ostreatus PC15]|uniref:WW domain-containing protein n=1 Tax=Pleurotus ostreatus (strain PC15) TaxID=1137138 RepID=A0A067NYZ7_PLEO1|nr:hypothetical protein PLEOSDRAFT_1082780 [Pleurotus ostreatus PC15]
MENPDKRPLPQGWITQYDSSSSRANQLMSNKSKAHRIVTTAILKGNMGDTQVQAEEAQAAIPGNSPATAHPHNPNTADTTPHPPPEAGADTSNLPLSRIGSKPRRLNKEGKARRLFGGLFGKKPSSGYGGGGGYGQQPPVYAQAPAKSGGMGMGGMLAAGGAGLIGGALIANALDDSQEDAYREGYEDAQDGGGFDDDF